MTTNILAIALPTLSVLVGILLNQNGLNRLDARMTALEARFAALETSLRAEIAALRISMHNDVVMLIERDNRLEQRVARLERAS